MLVSSTTPTAAVFITKAQSFYMLVVSAVGKVIKCSSLPTDFFNFIIIIICIVKNVLGYKYNVFLLLYLKLTSFLIDFQLLFAPSCV